MSKKAYLIPFLHKSLLRIKAIYKSLFSLHAVGLNKPK